MPSNKKREDGTDVEEDKLVRVRVPLWKKLTFLKLLKRKDSVNDVIQLLLDHYEETVAEIEIPILEEKNP